MGITREQGERHHRWVSTSVILEPRMWISTTIQIWERHAGQGWKRSKPQPRLSVLSRRPMSCRQGLVCVTSGSGWVRKGRPERNRPDRHPSGVEFTDSRQYDG